MLSGIKSVRSPFIKVEQTENRVTTGIVEKTFKDITEQIQRYIATKFLISLVTGIIIGIILWLFNIDFTVVWAVMAFFLNFIPTFGSIIACIPPILMALLQYYPDSVWQAVGGAICSN